MSATLKVITNIEIEVNGITYIVKQGATTDDITDQYSLTVDGKILHGGSTLATATARTLWDEDNQQPTDFNYFIVWADVATWLQLIGTSGGAKIPIAAYMPFVYSGNTILAEASTTPLSGTEPTGEAIDSIVLQNNSGGTGSYVFAVID